MKHNKLTVSINDCDIEIYHAPSDSAGAGKNIQSALLSLGGTKTFQKWVSKEVAAQLPVGVTADATATLNPDKMEIEITW